MEELLAKINKLYGINVSSFEKVEKGFLSENYFLQDGNTRLFLKKYRFDNSRRVTEVHASKKYFSNGGIPVILPVLLLNSSTFFDYEGSYYALFPFVSGNQFERGTLTDTAIISLGEMLGRIHLRGKESKLEIVDRFKIENKEKTFKKIEDILNQIRIKSTLTDFDKLSLQNVEMKKSLLLENTLTFEELGFECDHLIHGDYLDHNVFFDEDQHVQYVFDFEKTNYSPRTYELFRSMVYCILTTDVMDTDLENAKKYLTAYSSVYPISKDEIKRGLHLFFLKAIHGFWVESEHYLKDNSRVDHFLKDDYVRVAYLSKNLNKLIDVLTN